MGEGADGMEIVWSQSARISFTALLSRVEELFGNLIAAKVSANIHLHIELLTSFPHIGVRDFRFATDEVDIRYIINDPNLIYYAVMKDVIIIISIFDTRQSPEAICQALSELIKPCK